MLTNEGTASTLTLASHSSQAVLKNVEYSAGYSAKYFISDKWSS